MKSVKVPAWDHIDGNVKLVGRRNKDYSLRAEFCLYWAGANVLQNS